MSAMARSAALALAVLWLSGVAAEHITNTTEISLGTAITVFGLAFGAWAVVLGWVMFVIRREFHELRGFVREESAHRRESDERAHQDRLTIERRLTDIEANWRNHHPETNHG